MTTDVAAAATAAAMKIAHGTALHEWTFDNLVRDLLEDVQCHCLDLDDDVPLGQCAPCQIKTELCLRGFNELIDQIEESEGYIDPWDTYNAWGEKKDEEETSAAIVAAGYDPAYMVSPDEWGLMA